MINITNTEELIMMAILNQDLYGLQIAKGIEEVSNGRASRFGMQSRSGLLCAGIILVCKT